jgi:hypothetical protein
MDNSIKKKQMRYSRILTLSIFLSHLLFQFCYGQKEVVFPAEFPSESIGKKYCGTISTTGKMIGGYTAFLDLPFEMFVSKDLGVYARINPGDQFGRNEWGSTPTISNFVLWKTTDAKDKYGEVYGRTYYYKTPDYDLHSKYNIESFSIYNFFGSDKNPPVSSIYLNVYIPSYEPASISPFYKTTTVCEILRSEAEIRNEEALRLRALIEKDDKIKSEITLAMNSKEYFKALQLSWELHQKDEKISSEINLLWSNNKKQLDEIYKKYCKNIDSIKGVYNKDPIGFKTSHQNEIKKIEITVNGKEAYSKRIENATVHTIRKFREEYFENSFLYYKKGKHLLTPVGVDGNYYTNLFDTSFIDYLEVEIIYDSTLNLYFSGLNFIKNNKVRDFGVIINENEYNVEEYSMPLPEDIKNLFSIALTAKATQYLEKNFPELKIKIGYKEKIEVKGLVATEKPVEGKKNEKYDALVNQFDVMAWEVAQNSKGKSKTYYDTYYHPSILHLVKKLYPKADSIVLIRGDYQKELGKLALHLPRGKEITQNYQMSGKMPGASIIPLQKGIVELKGNKLKIYDADGNYKEIVIKYPIEEISKVALVNINIDLLELSAGFSSGDKNNPNYDMIAQKPIYYKEIEIGHFPANKAWSIDDKSYLTNDQLIIQLLPTYLKVDPYFQRINSWDQYYFYFDRDTRGGASGGARVGENLNRVELRKYLNTMTLYFEAKKKGEAKKAMKLLIKADKYLDKFIVKYVTLNFYKY